MTKTLSSLKRDLQAYVQEAATTPKPTCMNRGGNLCFVDSYYMDGNYKQPIYGWLWRGFQLHYKLTDTDVRLIYGSRNWQCFVLACEARASSHCRENARSRHRWFRQLLLRSLRLTVIK